MPRQTPDQDTTEHTSIVPFDDEAAPIPPSAPTFALPADTGLAGSEESADYDADSDFIPKPPFRFTPLTVGLIGLVVIGAGFLIGIVVDKHFGSSSSGTRTAATRGGFAGFGGEGFGAGGFGGTAGGTRGTAGFGSTTGGTTGTATTGNSAAGSGTSSAIPAVIGTVVSDKGTTLVVKNLGGKSVTVHLSHTTQVTAPYGTSALTAGTTVAVSGSTGSDGTVTATSVTAQ